MVHPTKHREQDKHINGKKKPLWQHTACMESRERESGQQGRVMKIRQLVLKGKKPERQEWAVPEIFLQHGFVFSAVILHAPFPPLMVPFSLLLGAGLCFLLPPFQAHEEKPLQTCSSPEPEQAPKCYLCHITLLIYDNHFKAHYTRSPYVTSALPKEFLFTKLMLSACSECAK